MNKRAKGTLDNYLQNRFKLDGNLFCRSSKIRSELDLISQIKFEAQDQSYQVNYERLISAYEQSNFSNESDEEDHAQYQYVREGGARMSKKDLNLREVFPSRNTFVFENGITISSDFESGNLMKCR